MTSRFFTAGDCPVCADSGALLCVTSLPSGKLILFCPLCETAWDQRPVEGRIDSVMSLQEAAPGGISLPSADEVQMSALGPFVEAPVGEWWELLGPHLRSTS
jgi:hypothetical protein